MQKLMAENSVLQSSLSQNEDTLSEKKTELENATEQLNKSVTQYGMQMDSMKRQLKINQDANMNMHTRLQESTSMIQEVTKQRDDLHQRCTELQQQCSTLSNKFMEYKNTSDMLFKVSDLTNNFVNQVLKVQTQQNDHSDNNNPDT